MDAVSQITLFVRRILMGDNVTYEEFESLPWEYLINRDYEYNNLWLAIRRFCDDEDIRSTDTQYDKDLRTSIKNTVVYIKELQNIKF